MVKRRDRTAKKSNGVSSKAICCPYWARKLGQEESLGWMEKVTHETTTYCCR